MSRSIVRLCCTMVLLYSSMATLRSQDQPADTNSLKPGAWALQFGIGGNLTLTSVQGASIAAKYHISELNAVRAGITLGANFGDGTTLNSQNQADTMITSGSMNTTNKSASASFILQYLWYANPNGVIHFYLALGPSFSYSYTSSDQDNSNSSTYNTSYTSRTTANAHTHSWGIGATGAAGVEWFAARWLSLRAEYADGIQYQWGSTTSTQTSSTSLPDIPTSFLTSSRSNKGWVFNSLGVSFGLNVYF